MEQDEQAIAASDAGEFREPGLRVGQVVDQAGGEERVGRPVGERQPAGVREDECGACRRGLRTCLGEHLGCQVGGDDGAVRPDRLAQGG
jgi:hypothetical protein